MGYAQRNVPIIEVKGRKIKLIIFILLGLFTSVISLFSSKPCADALHLHGDVKNLHAQIQSEYSTCTDPEVETALLPNPMQNVYKTTSRPNYFQIHYNTTGYHAVPHLDEDENGVPDYIDSVAYYLELVRNRYLEINFKDLTFAPDGEGGRFVSIYVHEIGQCFGYYGVTGSNGFVENAEQKSVSYIVIDNDYSPFDSLNLEDNRVVRTYRTTGIDGLKVTLAHEYFHAIQFEYRRTNYDAFAEMTATMMENFIFPDIYDYFGYYNSFVRATSFYSLSVLINQPGATQNGYILSVFARFLLLKYSKLEDGTFDLNRGANLYARYLDFIDEGNPDHHALNMAVKEVGGNFQEDYCEFTRWLYYTNDKMIDGYGFPESALMPELRPHNFDRTNRFFTRDEEFSVDASRLMPMGFNYIQFLYSPGGDFTNDTLDFLLANSNLDNFLFANTQDKSYSLIVRNSDENGFKQIDGVNSLFSRLEFEEEVYCNYISNMAGSRAFDIDFAYPNPARLGLDDVLFFPAYKSDEIYDRVSLEIYDEKLSGIVYQTKLSVIENSGKKIVRLNIDNLLVPGVYLFRVSSDKGSVVGKFAIVE